MKKLIYALIAITAVAVGIGCSEGSLIGNTLSDESVYIVVDSDFTVSGTTVPIGNVQSRTLIQLVGEIEARGFGNIHSDFVGQFMPSIAFDTVDVANNEIDSVKLFMQMVRGQFIGDSLAPMGITVYRLTKDLPDLIYSSFNPEGYYDPSNILAQGISTASTLGEPDSIQKLSTIYTSLTLPKQLGTEILNAYRENPSAFANPVTFAKDVFKGLYIRSSYGSGRITDFASTSIRFYFHKVEYNTDSARYDTINYAGDYLAVTPEVVINNDIRYEIAPELKQMAQDPATNIIVAPIGYETEIEFPAKALVERYRNTPGFQHVLNTLTFEIPVENIENDYEIAPPPYTLLILKKDKEKFFASNSLTNDTTSFYSAYDETNRCYTFPGMRNYMMKLLDQETISEDDYTFVLTPVQINTESSASSGGYYPSSSVVSGIVPYVSRPAMAKILLDKAKIKLTFSTNTGNFH